MTQHKNQIVILTKIEVDPLQLDKFIAVQKKQMSAAILAEPELLTFYVVSDKSNDSHITILEIYTDPTAYELHLETPHFKKYQKKVKAMVKSIETTDLNLITHGGKRTKVTHVHLTAPDIRWLSDGE